MNLLTDQTKEKIKHNILLPFQNGEYESAMEAISAVLDELYDNIPENRRISYGRVHTIKVLSEYLYIKLTENNAPVFQIASDLFNISIDYKGTGVALGILSFYGLEDYKSVVPYFEKAALSFYWDVREFAQMFFRKLIKKYPDEMREYLLQLVDSEDANIRRFVSETLRPVQENKWFYKYPDYPLSVLQYMFKESSQYPRTSVGNNLSDLSRKHPELVFQIIAELVESGDQNSYWIACRACRNLVKKEPIRVMNALRLNEYKYKMRIHKRSDYQGN